MKKLIFIFVMLLLVLFSDCNREKKTDLIEKKFTVKYVDLHDMITQTGEVKPVVKIDLKSEASGKIEKVYVKEGQRISKGDAIIDIDPNRLLFRKERLDLSVEKAQIEKSTAKRNLDNARKLTGTGTVSKNEVLDLESSFKLAEITYKQQLLELKDITDQLSKTKVRSPMDGVITSLDVEEGEIAVSATSGFQSGTSIATIADISRLEVVSQIGEVDYVHLKKEQKVIIKPEALRDVFTTGAINFISLSAKKERDDELGTFEVRISIDSLIPGIAPGINVNVEFVIMEKKNVLGIPNYFVRKNGKKHFVTLITGQETKKTKIRVGVTDYKHYEIKSGLKEGDVVLFKEKVGVGENEKKKGQGRRKGK